MSDAYDGQCINGDGQAPNVNGLVKQLTDPSNPTTVAGFDDFVEAFADQIDGLWASTLRDVSILANVDAYKLSAKKFRDRVIDTGQRGGVSLGDESAASYLVRTMGPPQQGYPLGRDEDRTTTAYRGGGGRQASRHDRLASAARPTAAFPAIAVGRMLDSEDDSKLTWREKFEAFVGFLAKCSDTERDDYLDAAAGARTGGIRVDADVVAEEEESRKESIVTLANVQVATGATKRDTRLRLMRAFNTPFLPDILVCSQVMGEGVDLQRHCRHVLHHDLAWNPSSIERIN